MRSSKRCTEAMRAGRMAKADQFYLAAETIATTIEDQDIADAYVTLCVHAGIAAADEPPPPPLRPPLWGQSGSWLGEAGAEAGGLVVLGVLSSVVWA